MKTKLFSLIIILLFTCSFAQAHNQSYGARVCQKPGYHCVTVKKGQTWYSLFPDSKERDLVRRLNRMNIPLYPGRVIAVPNNRNISYMDIAPFPTKVDSSSTNFIKINQKELAWGAYDRHGNLVNWGPMSGGKNYCPDAGRSCNTISGTFTFYRKQGAGCKSTVYPKPNGGAKMPYCMHFYRGFAMHGSATVPGHHASHGCVRIFPEDAKWINLNFLKVGITKIIIGRK